MKFLIKNTPFPDIFTEQDNNNYLFQGDIIKDIDILETKKPNLGFIILSNSCDLQYLKNKITISVSPIYPFTFVFNDMVKSAFDISKKQINKLKKNKDNYKNFNYFYNFKSLVNNYILQEANYTKKYTFFISPLTEFENRPTIAHIEHVISINKSKSTELIKNRIKSIKSPWSEKLGFMVGNLFNRVATYTPEIKEIEKWSELVFKDLFERKKTQIESLL